jgi:hypothetical protein
MSWTFLRPWFTRARATRKPARRKLFVLEHLEGRLTPSTVGLHITPTGQPTSLFEAVNTSSSTTDTVTFTAVATGGTGTQSVQWYLYSSTDKKFEAITASNTNFSGATTDNNGTATLTALVPSTVGIEQLYAQFLDTNAHGKVTAKATTHIVDLTTGNTPGTPTAITSTPPNDTVTDGQKITLMTSDTGTDLKVQWEVELSGSSTFTLIPGAHHDTLTVRGSIHDNGAKYEAVFSDPFGASQTTSPVTLTVDPVPMITTQPKSQHALINTPVTLSVVVAGSPASDTYQWYTVSGNTLTPATGASATTANYTFTPTADGRTVYVVKVTNSAGTSILSRRAAVTVITPPTKDVDPSSETVTAAGDLVTFTAEVTGSTPIVAEWEFETATGTTFMPVTESSFGHGFVIHTTTDAHTGVTTTTLTFKTKAAENGDKFEVIFTNPFTSTLGNSDEYTSGSATLTISPPG